MNQNYLKITKIIGIAVGIIVIAYSVFLFMVAPKMTYKLETIDAEGQTENPLLINITENAFDFEVKFISGEGENDKVKISKNLEFGGAFPFVRFSKDIQIKMVEKGKVYDEDKKVLYTVSGQISNLEKGTYRVSILDWQDNLIDERVFSIE